MTDIIIVGHGTSLRGAGLGSAIDSYDCPIVRFNGFIHCCGVEDMGSRMEYLCTTTKQFRFFLKDKVIPTRELWIYEPEGKFTYDQYKGPFYVADLDEWLDIYKGIRAGLTSRKFCKGLAAIIIAAKRLDISSILLFGFDNLWRGDRRKYATMGRYRNKGVYTSRHDYAAERKIVDIVSKRYGVNISHAEY